MKDFSHIWLEMVKDTLVNGVDVGPRGFLTKELSQRTIEVNMRKPVLRVPERRLSYKFMAAEAYWILSGDDLVSTIEPYNRHITQFSDDGVRFFGAYGPKIIDQLPYVIKKLQEDHSSRQAGLTIWRESPPATKDVPCTIAAFFGIRENKLNCHIFMRSSDIWLGIPYDVFNFSMLGHFVCCHLNENIGASLVKPGKLFLTAASSHLYAKNWQEARNSGAQNVLWQPETPTKMFSCLPSELLDRLRNLREAGPGSSLRWWEESYETNP